MVSIGGWTGGLYFSSNVGDATNRTIFVNTVIDMVTTYGLDGIDIEYVFNVHPMKSFSNIFI